MNRQKTGPILGSENALCEEGGLPSPGSHPWGRPKVASHTFVK